jgi:formylglycine-generating enzyme required for sulfatase activity
VEWEYAARGTSGWLYPWGNEFNANFANVDNPRRKAVRVNAFEKDKSTFGVVGLAGNVSEWTDSEYEAGMKVIRGGSYQNPATLEPPISPAEYARVTRRLAALPEVSVDFVGFRCAKDAPKQ